MRESTCILRKFKNKCVHAKIDKILYNSQELKTVCTLSSHLRWYVFYEGRTGGIPGTVHGLKRWRITNHGCYYFIFPNHEKSKYPILVHHFHACALFTDIYEVCTKLSQR